VTVVLDRDYRDDDAEPILAALRMVRGVAHVEGRVVDNAALIARMTATIDVRNRVFRAVEGALALDAKDGPDA
jgi:hypothetical protein